jgi:alpha-glucuronidase
VRARFASRDSVPENLLLWFHHVGWRERLRSGATLWEELLRHYQAGVDTVQWMQRTWDGLRGSVDSERFGRVQSLLEIQDVEARWWRDASVAYWESFSHLPLPPGYEQPPHPLAWYEALRCPRDRTKPRCEALDGMP